MKGPPIGPIGGPVRDLSPKTIAKIEEKFPNLSAEAINEVAWGYVLYRESDQPKYAKVREDVLSIKKMMLKLHDALCDASPAVRRLVSEGAILAEVEPNLLDALGGTSPAPLSLDEFRPSLEGALMAIAKGEGRVPAGHVISPHEWLVQHLARVLQAAGETPDARPNGPLPLVGIIFKDLDERVRHVRKVVERLLPSCDKSCV